MTLIEEYYELNEAEEVSVIWKIIQIIFYVCAACLGLWCGYTIASLRTRFENNCYLFTSIKSSILNDGSLDNANINWESDLMCDYCQYSMVSSFIVATIWATFFLMCGKGGKSLTGLPQPWRIVWPSLIFNFIYFIVSLTTAINIQKGSDQFCARLYEEKSTHSFIEKCEPLKLLLKRDFHITRLQIHIVTKTSWACAMSWLILFLISFFRIIFVIDFHLYKICVFKIDDTIHNKKEEVLRITNYEEPKKLYFGADRDKRITYSEFDDDLEELEEGKKRRTKFDKTSIQHQFNPASRSLLQPNAAFYITADIRMLNREKKRKKSSKSLDQAFEINNSLLTGELKKHKKIKSQADDSVSTGLPEVLYRYSKELLNDEDEDSLSSTTENVEYLGENWDDSFSDIDVFGENVEMDQSIRLKKQI